MKIFVNLFTIYEAHVRDEIILWIILPLGDEVGATPGHKGSAVPNVDRSVSGSQGQA